MKRSVTSLVVVLAAMTYGAVADAVTLQPVLGELHCDALPNKNRDAFSVGDFRGVYGPTTLMLLNELEWIDGDGTTKRQMRQFNGRLKKRVVQGAHVGKIELSGEGTDLVTTKTWPYEFLVNVPYQSLTPDSFPIHLNGTEGSGDWLRSCTFIITTDTTIGLYEDVIDQLDKQIADLKMSLQEAQQKEGKAAAGSISEEQYSQLEKDYQTLEQTLQAGQIQHQETIDVLSSEIAALKVQLEESKQATSAAQSDVTEEENRQLIANYSSLEKVHNELRQQLETLKAEYEPLRQAHQAQLAASDVMEEVNRQLLANYSSLEKVHNELRQQLETLKAEYEPLRQAHEAQLSGAQQRLEEQVGLAEQLVSQVQPFMEQNPNLPELISLLQLTRKLKASIAQGKIEPLENSYSDLTAVLAGIESFDVFLEQQAKIELAVAEQKRKEAEEQKKEEAERQRKAEEDLLKKGQQLMLEMRQYVVKHMDDDDIDVHIANLTALEETISSRDIEKIRLIVETNEAEAKEKNNQEEARLVAEGEKKEEARLVAEGEKKEAEKEAKANTLKEELERSKSCPNCDLRGENLANLDLTGGDLSGANLRNANLTNAFLSGAFMMSSDMAGANLTNAIMTDVMINEAFMAGIDLTGAVLDNAVVIGSDLTQANLTGTNLTGTNLMGTNLTGANLTDTIFCGTVMPNGDINNSGC